MSIEFPCSSCGSKLRVPDGTSGKKAKCPTCQTMNIVPDADAAQPVTPKPKPSIEFPCSSCEAKLRVPEGSAGKKAKCPTCQTVNIIPGDAPTASVLPKPESTASMPSPLNDPFGLQDEDFLRNENQDWGRDDFIESDNPFQAPNDFDGVRGSAASITDGITPTKLYFTQAIAETFRNFLSNIKTYLLTSVVMILSHGAVYVVWFLGIFALFPYLFRSNAGPEDTILTAGLMFLAFILFCMIGFGLLGLGFLSCFISIAKTEHVSMEAFFKGVKKFLPCFVYWILLFLVNLGLGILFQVAFLLLLARGGGGLTSLILGFVLILLGVLVFLVNFRMMWGFWLIIDQNLSIGSALRISREICVGNAWKGFLIFFAAFLVVTLWYMLVLFVCSMAIALGGEVFSTLASMIYGVANILTWLLAMPFFTCLYTVVYLLMSGQHPRVRQEKTQW